jgi:hypothetical protein
MWAFVRSEEAFAKSFITSENCSTDVEGKSGKLPSGWQKCT